MREQYEDGMEPIEEEVPLTAEEIFEQHKAEIDAAFEEKNFFQRMKAMFAGLSMPKNSPEYKIARVELQRLAAPILAILLPTLGVIVLIVVTAVSGQQQDIIQINVVQTPEEEEKLEEDKPEEIEETPPPEEMVDVQVDTPVVAPFADQDTPVIAPNEPVSVKPASQDSVAIIRSPITMRSMTGSRNPGMIGRLTSGGARLGDRQTEDAVMKILRWLKKTQQGDGSWAGGGNPIANTALAVLSYLAHGETPSSPEFGETVEKALQYLIGCLTRKKDKSGNDVPSFYHADQNEYATLIATYALCEAYGMTKNPNTKDVAEQTLQRIVDNQSPTGGWDYGINKDSTRDDMSFAGWALQALKAGKMAGLHPEGLDRCIKKAIKCLQTRNFKNGGFNYTAGGAPTGLTATGCLAMQLLGYANKPEVTAALDTMRGWLPVFVAKGNLVAGGPTPGTCPQYYCYYATQCKYQAGMCDGATAANVKSWQDWNAAMKALYPKSVKDAGTIEGPNGKQVKIGYIDCAQDGIGMANMKTMSSCLVALQLMVYYRYLPTTSIKAGQVENEDAPADSKKTSSSDEVDVKVDI